MEENQFVSKIVTSGTRLMVQIPKDDKPRFSKQLGKDVMVTIESL